MHEYVISVTKIIKNFMICETENNIDWDSSVFETSNFMTCYLHQRHLVLGFQFLVNSLIPDNHLHLDL